MATRFRFTLTPVLELRERVERERAADHAMALAEQLTAERRRDELCERRDALRDDLVREHGGLDVTTLRATYAHLDYLDRGIIEADAEIVTRRAATEGARLALVAAAKDRKVLETLRDRRREAHDAEVALADQRDLDDLNARSFDRAALEGASS